MLTEVLNQQNQKTGEIDLPEAVFKVKWNPDLVHQVLTAQAANRRRPWAHTKNRGEVRGGGKKPWRQKGTGRARHGSIRSPLWKGGGITFGPRKERSYVQKINKKMRRLAINSVLSKKLADQQIKIIDAFNIADQKTKTLHSFLKMFLPAAVSAILIPESKNKNIFLASRNLPKVKTIKAADLNVYDLLSHRYVVFAKDAIKELAVGR